MECSGVECSVAFCNQRSVVVVVVESVVVIVVVVRVV